MRLLSRLKNNKYEKSSCGLYTQKIRLPIPKWNGDTWFMYELGQSSSCPHFDHEGSLECDILGEQKTSCEWVKHGVGKEFEPKRSANLNSIPTL